MGPYGFPLGAKGKITPYIILILAKKSMLGAVTCYTTSMSFQAYLDNIQAKTGKTANDFIALAKAKGFNSPSTKAGEIVAWLKEDFDLGHGHAMAIVHVIKHGDTISDKHVGTTGTHRDESSKLNLDGKK